MIDGMLLQTVEGLGEQLALPGSEVWEWLQGEKEKVGREILSDGPLCHGAVNGMQESEAAEEYGNQVEWQYRGHLEERLRELGEAQDRLMAGAYGRCTDCGAEIDKRRLAADPALALCITCQRSTEPEVQVRTL